MAVKAKPKAKKPVKKAVKKPVRKAVKKAAPALTCEVCGYRVIIDEECGCVEEHVLLCCDRPMTRS